jgi:drug/metabolite transporter (DMT)-like permease
MWIKIAVQEVGPIPLFTIVIAHFLLRDNKMTLPKALGLVTGFLGVVVLLRNWLPRSLFVGSAWGSPAPY